MILKQSDKFNKIRLKRYKLSRKLSLISNFNLEVLLDTVQVLPVHQGAVGGLVVDELAGEGDGPVLVPVDGESPRPT